MKSRNHIAAVFTTLFIASCATTYQSATISRIEPTEKIEKISSQAIVYRYRIHGLQQTVISLDPKTGLIQSDNSSFTQNELSKLRVRVVSLNGQLSVNGLKISQGEVLVVDLKKWYNFNGQGGVKAIGKYLSVLRFVINPANKY
jgi:hypothetical protein